jgi:hypothetical protein
MTRLLPRWCVLGVLVSLGGTVPAAAQFALRADTLPVNDVGGTPGELYGLVHDTHGRPLPGAVVSALGSTSAFRVSDREGRFAFRGLPPGTYLVRVHLEGYEPGRSRSVQIASDARTHHPVALSRRGAADAATRRRRRSCCRPGSAASAVPRRAAHRLPRPTRTRWPGGCAERRAAS